MLVLNQLLKHILLCQCTLKFCKNRIAVNDYS